MGSLRNKVYAGVESEGTSAPPRERTMGPVPTIVVGLVYLVFSMGCNLAYLVLLAPHASNDHWWPRFNVTGTQTFLADVVNAQLHLGTAGQVNVLSLGMAKSYAAPTTFVDLRRSSARQFLLGPVEFSAAIAAMRRNGVAENLRVPTQFCWADLGRRFELAHTAERQRRCHADDKWTNAALVLGAVLRNIDVRALLASEYAAMLDHCVLEGIAGLSDDGQEWVDTIILKRNASMGGYVHATVEAEAAAWGAAGFDHWTLQLQNLIIPGFVETIAVVNALGMRQSFEVHHVPTSSNTLAGWTTSFANAGFWNDLGTCEGLGCSLVRNTPNSIDAMAIDWDVASNGPLPDGTGDGGEGIGAVLVHAHLGPLASVDIELVAIPASLAAYYRAFRRELFAALETDDKLFAAFSAQIDGVAVDAAPWSATEYWFYGGNPMCPKGVQKPFVQTSFGFDDDCSNQVPDMVTLDRVGVLFALATITDWTMAIDGPLLRQVCALTSASSSVVCEEVVASAALAFALLRPHLKASSNYLGRASAVKDTVGLNITTVQFATAVDDSLRSHPLLLVQSVAGQEPLLLADSASMWPFFGWITVFEWLDGRREVYDFQGDIGTFKLMSAPLPFQSMVANPAQLPHSACQYVHYISIYASVVLVVVALAASTAGVAATISNRSWTGHLSHWTYFNRVVGSVWVGRPLLCIRGMTAIMVLATAPMDLVASRGQVKLVSTPRSLGYVGVVAGEATWLSYVLSDMLLPAMHGDAARVQGPVSACLAWSATVLWEVLDPWQVQTTLGRESCKIQSFRQGVSCSSGEIQVGSPDRVLVLLVVQVVSTVLATCVALVAIKWRPSANEASKHALLPGASAAFLTGPVDAKDVVGCIMSGILPTLHPPTCFDVKLWMPIKHLAAMHNTSPIQWPAPTVAMTTASSLQEKPQPKHWRQIAWPIFGLAYMVVSVASSYSFLQVTKSTMANDFWWVGFDTPGTHAYLANWFNQYLQLTDYIPAPIQLPDPRFAAISAPTNLTQTSVVASSMYSSAPHRGLSTLTNVVAGLRATPGCALPWIFTAYCFVDLDKRWELAQSAIRQQRCRNMTQNGAVFLEAVLRNANWGELMGCWEQSLNVGVFNHLKETTQGQKWLDATQHNALSVADEVQVWTQRGIAEFTTQWQNFKRLGIYESFLIRNAFGVSYGMSLKKSNGTLQLASQTSFQLYWSFASDLWAVAANATRLSGRSLVRTSRDYAWQNLTLEDILFDNATLHAPLPVARFLVRDALGPFGSIDAKRVPCPESLRVAHQVGTETLARTLSASGAAQEDFWKIFHTFNYSPIPGAWGEGALGGSLLCDINSATSKLPGDFFTYKGGCGMFGVESTLGSTVHVVKSILAVGAHNITPEWVISTCEREHNEQASCASQLSDSIAFLEQHVSPAEMDTMSALGEVAKATIRDDLRVEYVQFVQLPGSDDVTLAHENLFESRDMEHFSWLMLWEWVDGKREVTEFQGDAGRICTLSTMDGLATSPTSAMDVPLNVANYLRALVQYTSLVLFGVAVVVCVYIVANRGRVEGINMLSFNRVCGLVWIGRPLLFLRGVTALCLLSTASLQLTRPHSGLATSFQSNAPYWVATALSSGEMTWLVYVVNDLASVGTRQFTGKTAMFSTIVAGLVALVWSLFVAVKPYVELRRECTWVHVDFQLTCTSGSVHIGRFDRFGGLLGVVFAACGACYVGVRRRNPTLQPTTTSLLLHPAAKYHFRRRRWEVGGTYHLDRASAAMNGLVSIDFVDDTVVLDVKAWRTYFVRKQDCTVRSPSDGNVDKCLPLVQGHGVQ